MKKLQSAVKTPELLRKILGKGKEEDLNIFCKDLNTVINLLKSSNLSCFHDIILQICDYRKNSVKKINS